ncbi:MAG: DUF4249 domain-containing protein [Bacteroidia bacterium]|nr:DUF4249 domain-containing protein [Bacteroidia bacterium]NNK28620.1 DUF4249 family protein [Flavobacteriaceae bacterium]
MQHLRPFISLLLCILFLSSCEDVIQVDVAPNEKRLIVDGIVRVDTEQPSTEVRVKVSETSSFFNDIQPAVLENITLNNLTNPPMGNPPILGQIEPGVYGGGFSTEEIKNDRWVLVITYEEKFYIAFAEFTPTVPIDNLEFGDGNLLDEDDTELVVTFTDQEDRDDYYIFDFDFDNFLVTEDEFYQGQQFEFSYFYDENLEPGEEIEVSILGADQALYEYMNIILEQTDDGFNVFETPVATVHGNVFNATTIDNIENFNNVNTPDNFPLGYFTFVQEYKQTIIVE